MAGSLSTIGLGSSGVLSYDLIEKLKNLDVSKEIKPTEKKIEENMTKQKDLTAIKLILSKFNSSVKALSSDSTYMQRNVNVSGKSAEATVSAGVKTQDIKLSVSQLAQHDSYQTKAFENSNSFIFDNDTKFGLKIGSSEFEIRIDKQTSLNDIANQINEKANGRIEAKILNVGSDGDKKSYKLIIQSKDTGKSNAISFKSFGDESNAALEKLGLNLDDKGELVDKQNHIQVAQDSKFVFNGISITRDTNSIKDLITGVSINLKSIDKDDEFTTIQIRQDNKSFKEDMANFVKNYNELINNLAVATSYNDKTETSGTFQGNSEINSIKSSINKILISINNSAQSIQDFGLSMTKDGLLELDNSKLDQKLNNNFDDVKNFFSTKTTFESVTYFGATFNDLNEDLEVKKDQIIINGKSVEFKITAGMSKDEVSKAFLAAISKADISGIKAFFDGSNALVIKGIGSQDIKIDGDVDVLSKFGLSKSTLKTKTISDRGLFGKLKDTLEGFLGLNGSLTTFEHRLTQEHDNMIKEKEKTQKSLDAKYEIMAQKFMAYDIIISKLNAQSTMINNMIQMEINKK